MGYIYFLKDYKVSKKKSYKAGDKVEESKSVLNSGQILSLKKSKIVTDDEEVFNKAMNKDNKESSENTNIEMPASVDVKEPTIPTTNIISVPDEETNKTVNEALSEAQKVIDEANKYYNEKKKSADDLFESVDMLVKEQIEKTVNPKKQELDTREQELDTREQGIEEKAKKAAEDEKQKALAELEEQRKVIEAKSKEIESNLKKLLDGQNALSIEKSTFKADMELGFKKQYDDLIKEKEELSDKISDLEKTIKQKNSEILGLRDDNSFIEEQLDELNNTKDKIREVEFAAQDWKLKYEKLEESYKKKLSEISELNTQLLEYGNNPEQVIKDKKKLEEELEELRDLKASNVKLSDYQKLEDSFKELERKYNDLASKNADLTAQNIDLKVMQNDIENYRRYIKVLDNQKRELEYELQRNAELYNNRAEKIFANLSEIDNDSSLLTNYPDNPSITLKEICENFRGYLAFRPNNQLYYDEDVIRTFVAGFASSRLMILEGLSGTGKSSLPRAFMDYLGAHTIKVPVQSSWKDRNDLLGFYNDFKKQYKETDFLKALYRATRDKDGIYLIVLDEMNLSRIEYYFADLLSVLEEPDPKDWEIELISDYASINPDSNAWPKLVKNGKLNILDNTWFIGTANKDDSTFMITDKVYDRSVVIDFQKKGQKGSKAQGYDYNEPIKLNNEDFQRLLRNAKAKMSAEDKRMYKELIDFLDKEVVDLFEITFGNRIQLQLDSFVPCYINCGGSVHEAVDVMFSKKVLRKLEGKYDDNTKTGMQALIEEIEKDTRFKGKLPRTVETLRKMIAKI